MTVVHNSISRWPEMDRPREKLLQLGPASLSDAELLAILIRTGSRGKSALDLARELLTEHGGLRAIFNRTPMDICDQPGLGTATAATLLAAVELGSRFAAEKLHRRAGISSPADVCQFLSLKLRDRDREVFAVLFLDARHQVICYEEMFLGTLNGAPVHPREVVKRALAHNAGALIIAHNHPSGIAEPSHSDQRITRRLVDALKLVDITLLDHIVIGDGEYVSMSDRGLM